MFLLSFDSGQRERSPRSYRNEALNIPQFVEFASGCSVRMSAMTEPRT